MAARFWVGGTGNWDAATTTNWSATSGGGGGASVPGVGDDVTFNSASNATLYTVTITATANCLSLNIANPASGALTLAGSSTLNIAASLAITSVITRTYTGTINFTSTTTGNTLAFGGVTMASATVFNGVNGAWTVNSAWNNGSSNITITNGSWNLNGQTLTCGQIASNNSNIRTITLGAATITTSSGWNTSTNTNLTLSAASSIFTPSTNNTFTTGAGLTFHNLTFPASGGQSSLLGGSTWDNVSYTGGATLTDRLDFSGNTTITTALTLNGNSTINRILINTGSNNTGVTATITLNGSLTTQHTDWMDITGAGSFGWNLSAITGNSGDCGGNSGITFTTPATQNWTNTSGGNWSLNTNWTSRIPLPQDDVTFNCVFTASRTVTANMARLGKSISWASATFTTALTFTLSTTCDVFGSMTLLSTSGFALGVGTTGMTFRGRSSYTISCNGLTWEKPITLNAPGGTLACSDNFTMGTTRTFLGWNGTFDGNGKTVTAGIFSIQTNVSAITMGAGKWTITGTGTSVWSTPGTLTYSTGPSTILEFSGAAPTLQLANTTTSNKLPDVRFTNASTAPVFAGGLFCAETLTVTGTNTVTISSGPATADLWDVASFTTGTWTLSITAGVNTWWIWSRGNSFYNFTLNRSAGSLTNFRDTLTVTNLITITQGTMNVAGGNTDVVAPAISTSNSNTRAIRFGTGTWTLNGTGTVYDASTSTNLTIVQGTGTIKITDASVTGKTFAGGGKVYPNIWFTGAGSGTLTISGSNTFLNFKVDTQPKTVIFTAGTTTTITSMTATGTSGNLITMQSSAGASAWNISCAGGPIYGNYLSLQDSAAAGGALFYAGRNSTNVSGNSGWIFADYVPGNFLAFF